MITRTIGLLALVLALVLALTACGNKLPPDTSPEARVAVRGTQVMAALRATIPTIKGMVCTPATPQTAVPSCIKPTDADKVFAGMEKAGEIGEQLSVALTAVDTAKDAAARGAAMQRVALFVRSLQASLAAVQVTPENVGARNALVELLGTVTGLLFAIGGVA